jgi:hypothetical protein
MELDTPPFTNLIVTLPLLSLDFYATLFYGLHVVSGFSPHPVTRLALHAHSVHDSFLHNCFNCICYIF